MKDTLAAENETARTISSTSETQVSSATSDILRDLKRGIDELAGRLRGISIELPQVVRLVTSVVQQGASLVYQADEVIIEPTDVFRQSREAFYLKTTYHQLSKQVNE